MKHFKLLVSILVCSFGVLFVLLTVNANVPRRGYCERLSEVPFIGSDFLNSSIHSLEYDGAPTFISARGKGSAAAVSELAESLNLNLGYYEPDFGWLSGHGVRLKFLPPFGKKLNASGKLGSRRRSFVVVHFVPDTQASTGDEGIVYIFADR